MNSTIRCKESGEIASLPSFTRDQGFIPNFSPSESSVFSMQIVLALRILSAERSLLVINEDM